MRMRNQLGLLVVGLLLVACAESVVSVRLRFSRTATEAAAGVDDQSLLEAAAGMTEPTTPDLVNSPCMDCQKFVTAITTVAARLSLNREQMTVRAQALSQQMDVCSSLNLECHVYAEVKRWLTRATILDDLSPAAQVKIRDNPHHACHAVNVCGRLNLTALVASANPRGRPNQPVMVRLKLIQSVSALSRTSPEWKLFVKNFLHAVSQFLGIPTDRLALHQHQSDELTEIVIRAASDPSPSDKRTPTELGQILKANLKSGATALTLPSAISQAVDVHFAAQVLPLVVPQTLPSPVPGPVSNMSNSSLPDCSVLQARSKAACGESYHCSDDCKTAFAQYHGKCLSRQLDAQQHLRIFHEYQRFFELCEKCTAKRLATVTARCGFQTVKDISMPNSCSQYCSEAFVPYYQDCLQEQSESWTTAQRETMEKFYHKCGSCTKVREKAVRQICDDRIGPQAYYYPGTCTSNCSSVFPAFYDSCLDGALGGVQEGAQAFRGRCQTAADGGVFFRIVLRQDIATIVHMTDFKNRLIVELSKLLQCPASRMDVTGVKGEPSAPLPLKAGEYQGVVQHTPARLVVDLVMKISSHTLDPDPMALVDKLRIGVSKPSSLVYTFPMCQYIDSFEGVKLLVANSHDLAKQTGPSSLQLAIAELQKGQEHHAPKEVINYLQAIVTYHTAIKQGVPTTRSDADLARVAYFATLAHNASPDTIAYYKARYTEALDKDKKAAVKVLAKDKALVDYMGAVTRGDTQKVINADYGILEWRTADANNADAKDLGYLHAVMIQLLDISRDASPEALNYDKAEVSYMSDVKANAPAAKLDLDDATVAYLNQLRLHTSKPVADAAKALMEYRQAILDHASAAQQADKQAALNYFVAVREQKEKAVLDKLAAIMVDMHRKAVEEGHAKL